MQSYSLKFMVPGNSKARQCVCTIAKMVTPGLREPPPIHTADITLLWRSGWPGPGRGLLFKPAVHGAVDRGALRVPQHHDEPRARLLHAARHSCRHLGRRTVALGPAAISFICRHSCWKAALPSLDTQGRCGALETHCVREGKGMAAPEQHDIGGCCTKDIREGQIAVCACDDDGMRVLCRSCAAQTRGARI